MTLKKIIIVDSMSGACAMDNRDVNEHFYTRTPTLEGEWLCAIHDNGEEYFYKAKLNDFPTPNNPAKFFQWILRNKSEVPLHVLATFTLLK